MSLQNLLKLQQQKKAAETATQPAVNPPATQVVESESPKVEPVATPPEPPEPAKPKGLGLNLLKPGQVVGATQKGTGGVPVKTSAKAQPKPIESSEPAEFTLDQLAAMDASDIAPVETRDSQLVGSGYEDEIEATAPDRDLPDDLVAEQLAFVESLNGIYGVLHDADMFGQSVRLIMIELQENPEYERLLSDSDVHVMIRGMRRTMGLARVRKQEKSRKATGQKAARKKAGVGDDVLGMLNSLMGDDDD